MKNNNVAKLIILAIIVLLIILAITIIVVLKLKLPEEEIPENALEEIGEDFTENYGKSETGGIDKQSYSDIKACMKKYLSAINMKSLQYGTYNQDGVYTQTLQDSEIKQKIYNLLSQKYINEKNITVDNVYDHIKVIQETAIFVPIEATMIQDTEIKSFIIQGLIESAEDYKVIDEIYAIVNINFVESEFSIEPIYEDYSNIDEIKIEKFEDTIITNTDNKFYSEYISTKNMPGEYMNLYKRLVLGYPEKAYELLDNEYRNTKFGNLEKFKEYIENNKEEIKNVLVQKYQVNTDNNEVVYTCLDQNENYYIFKENEDFLNYTIILDTYTIDLPEFIDKYNNAKAEKKVGMNIEKIFAAIKDKDYKYIYSKLDNTFKNNKFPTQKNLENYIESNLSKAENIEYIDFSQEGNIYVYKTKTGEKYFNVIMQLGEGTQYTMSFSIE